MKLVVFFLLSVGFGFSQNTYIPDDNFEQAIIDLGFDSGPLDDYVPTNAISSITFLDIGEMNISDLTGIEDFTDLNHIRCHLNNLSVLDFSNNSNLRIIKCDQNNLTELILGSNSTLEQIWTYDNALTTIDVSQLPNLEILSISDNNLTGIDVSNNPSLRNFWCFNNDIPSVDISNNVNLEIFWCSQNDLITLDVTNNPNLETFLCYQNSISTLDLSNNTELAYIACHFNDLTYLNVKNGNNTNVTNFQAYGNAQLNCIEVDDPMYSEANWTQVDFDVSFYEDCDNLSVQEVVFNQIKIFPNPTFDQIIISGINESQFHAILYDINGKEIMDSNSNIIDISNLDSGVYYLKISTNNAILTKKVVKH
ncbi:T9SS type A sorting domain-containing protein [Psychroserpens sp. XS_ASV72]|uniref:leucine-rich repeat domain-containing protein n=1 Tax=Psychroserpens sp. XS_ASV72 TaxID=3241293 RepID=UPI003518508C